MEALPKVEDLDDHPNWTNIGGLKRRTLAVERTERVLSKDTIRTSGVELDVLGREEGLLKVREK